MTPRQRVLKKYPGAYAAVCWRMIAILGYVICDKRGVKIGRMKDSPKLAWENAAEKLRRTSTTANR